MIMRTDLIDLNSIPSDSELISLLGDYLFKCYSIISKDIRLLLYPNIERWAKGGRRGKYYDGFIIDQKHIQIDLFLISKQITCLIYLNKRLFNKILRFRDDFSLEGNYAIDSCIRLNKIYSSGYYLEFLLRNETDNLFNDLQNILNIISH